MFRNILFCLLATCYVFSAEYSVADQPIIDTNGLIICKNRSIRLVTSDPMADMRLSPCPVHQCPPLFLVTLPHGQRIVFLGTTHTFPLACILPYWLARDLIEQSAFTFAEVGEELIDGTKKPKEEDDDSDDEYPEFVLVKPADIERIKAGERDFYKEWHSDDALNTKVNQTMSTIFDSTGKWYAKAGLLDRDDILGQIARASPKEKQLHPAALAYVYKVVTGNQFYELPSCGGMDHHLIAMSRSNYGRLPYALESEDMETRFGEDFFEKNNVKIEASINSDCKNLIWYEGAIKGLLESGTGKPKVTIENCDADRFYSADIALGQTLFSAEDYDFMVIKRNQRWFQRIMTLDDEHFKLAFGHVGLWHLADLFERLSKVGCTVSRLPLAEIEPLLLDEKAVLGEHVRLTTLFK